MRANGTYREKENMKRNMTRKGRRADDTYREKENVTRKEMRADDISTLVSNYLGQSYDEHNSLADVKTVE